MHSRTSTWFSPGPVRSCDATAGSLTYHCSNATLGFSHSDDFWLRCSLWLNEQTSVAGRDGRARSRSWALDPEREAARSWRALEVDEPRPVAGPRSIRYSAGHGGVEGNVNPHEDTRGIVAGSVSGLSFTLPLAGIHTETLEVSRSRDGLMLSLPLDPELCVYGLGEKTGTLDKRGRTWTMWNTDEPDHTPDRDPLYQSIPVIYLFAPTGTTTIFIDSTATIHIDAGEASAERLQLEIHDPAVDVYLRHDASLPDAVTAYTDLTGRHPLPPEWALGFQQCRYSYFPESRVLAVAAGMREHRIPLDVLYLDIHYLDGYRVFTWDRSRFPDPGAMIARLREQGIRLVTIVDPGVKADTSYPVFADGARKNLFLQEPTGGAYRGTVWPGTAVFPDFTEERTREWWAGWHRVLFDAGVSGVWNDMNEPADFSGNEVFRPEFTVPDLLVAGNDGEPAPMEHLHNAYANGMNRATRTGLERYRSDERGFVLTRAGFAGVQRSAAVWTGDNHSWWEHIGLMTPMLSNLGLSGVAFCGGDVGGFQQNAVPELYARWVAAACLAPLFRGHSALDTVDHEPWSFGEDVLAITRRYVGLRYRLMPLLYTLMRAAAESGAPLMRPLVWEFPYDPRVRNRSDSYMVGDSLLVAPVGRAGVQERSVYLPAGVWYDVWSGTAYTAGDPRHPERGGRVVACDAALDRLPLFIRGGSIVPVESLRQHSAEPGDGLLRLLVAPDTEGSARGTLYADAGEGWGYRSGEYWEAEFELSDGRLELTVNHGKGLREIRWDRVAAWNLDDRRAANTDAGEERGTAATLLGLTNTGEQPSPLNGEEGHALPAAGTLHVPFSAGA